MLQYADFAPAHQEFDPARLMSSLVTSHCGTSNLDQRAGRAGRVRPGDYFGLFSRKRLATFPTYTVVEMQRLDLSEVVMHVKGECGGCMVCLRNTDFFSSSSQSRRRRAGSSGLH